MSQFTTTLPVENRTFQKLCTGEGYGEIYVWLETVKVEGQSFDIAFQAFSDMWSGFGDPSCPQNHQGPWFTAHCLEPEPTNPNSLKAMALEEARNHTPDFDLYCLASESRGSLAEARENLEGRIREFLSGKLDILLGIE